MVGIVIFIILNYEALKCEAMDFTVRKGCKSLRSSLIIYKTLFGKAAQMVDGQLTVTQSHKKLRGFESLLSHKKINQIVETLKLA